MKIAAVVLLSVIAAFALVIGVTEFGFRLTQHYAPAYEGVRRQTFEQSRAYQEGTVRDLENLRLEWFGAGEAQKAAIAAVAQHRLADVDPALLTPELRLWRDQLLGVTP